MTAPEPSRIGGDEEVLLRQVHPSWRPGGELQKTAFNPTSKDNKKLSTLRGAVGADEAYRRWTQDLERESVGTYGVAIAEVTSTTYTRASDQATVGLFAIDDADVERVPDHASIAFTELSKEQRTQAARKLRDHAAARGCLHP